MNHLDKIQYEPLREEEVCNTMVSVQLARGSRPWSPPKAHALLIHATLLIIYTALSIAVIHFERTHYSPDPKAFPGLVVDYEFRKFDFSPNSTFAGEPRPESEAAWHRLMSNMAVRVTSEELAAHNQTSVSLPNGGYLAWLGVFHQLHCVKVLRHWAWREHYESLANMSSHEVAHHMVHVDHCVETLRSAAICRADTEALAVFKWLPDTPRPIFDTKRVEHRCVNWDSMMTSSYADRVVTLDEINSLKNPFLK